MSEPHVRRLAELLPGVETVVTGSFSKFRDAKRDDKTVAVVDGEHLGEIVDAPSSPTIIVGGDQLPVVVGWLANRPWLAHVVSDTALQHPLAGEHLRNVSQSLVAGKPPRLLDWVDKGITGRRVKLAQASRRGDRLDRMSEFFAENGTSARTVQVLRDAAEELLTNAFYDAPVAAGVVGEAISRTRDVTLPDDHACDMAYGCRDDVAMVRVRDPFGSLRRKRLIEVLSRCARTDMQVEVDETMGGAGLGLWRIFSGASLVAISVVAGRATDILVATWKRAGVARPFACHMYFYETDKHARNWTLSKDSTLTTAVTLLSQP
jgi:hypothetical protein